MIETITTRIFLMRRLMRLLHIDPFDILDQYTGQVFNSGIPKQIVFREFLISDAITDPVLKMIGESCSGTQLATFRDKRSPEEYAAELVLGWILEDIICFALEKVQLSAHLTGTDAGREFLQSAQISGTHDLGISGGTKEIKLEVVTDYTNYWSKTDTCDLRHGKAQNMHGSFICGISLQQPKFFLMELNSSTSNSVSAVVHHEKWDKPVQRISGIKTLLQPIKELPQAILSALSVAS